MNIALIAHDAKKILMQNFCIAYRGILSKHEIYATGTTAVSYTHLDVYKRQIYMSLGFVCIVSASLV